MPAKGTVYWITGLSGAGKTTIGQKLFWELKRSDQSVVLLDGDVLRDIFDEHSFENDDRLRLSQCYARLCKGLADQGINVVIATISMFHVVRDWNRKNIDNYREIYLKVPFEVLEKRDAKSIYSKAAAGTLRNVVGVTSTFEAPLAPDLVISNYGELGPDEAVKKILRLIQCGG